MLGIQICYLVHFQSDLTWPLWMWYYVVAVSSGALKGMLSFFTHGNQSTIDNNFSQRFC